MARKSAVSEPKNDDSNLYEGIGGRAACRALSVAFYARVEQDPLLRPLFPGKSFRCAIEEFTAFLAQFLGGLSEYSQRRWWLSLRESHLRFKIGPAQRTAWMSNMVQAFDDVPIDEPLRSHLLGFFERSSAYVVNQGEAPAVANTCGAEIDLRWDAQTRIDEAVAAIRGGDADRAIGLAESSALQACSKSVRSGILGLMIRGGHGDMLAYVRASVAADPALIQERYAGRTLLHQAAAAGCLPIVELLLSLGADPDTRDAGGHTPLYSLGNECGVEGGGNVVRALAAAGADVNAHDGVKHCTPLHMAARRGHVEIAGALLDCGAEIEARDTAGETPLRRAVNCDQVAVASLLMERGANRHSAGSKGITPVLAARSAAMKMLLRRS